MHVLHVEYWSTAQHLFFEFMADATSDLAVQCTPFDALSIATEHLQEDLHLRASANNNIWREMIPRKEFIPGKGLTSTTFVAERSEPTADEEEWFPIGSVAESQGNLQGVPSESACGVRWTDTYYGHNALVYAPEAIGLRSPVVCEDELIYTHMADRFMETYMTALTIRSSHTLENRLMNIYMHMVPKNSCNSSYSKIAGGTLTVNHTPPTSPSLAGLPTPTSMLTQDMLDTTALELMRDGATNPNSQGWITIGDMGPEFPILISPEASQSIVRDTLEFRKDYRYAEPMELLKRLGAYRVVKNFRHIPNLFPPRWHAEGPNLVRTNTWLKSPATHGFGAEINPQWVDPFYSRWEGSIVLNPWVFHEEIVRPHGSSAGMTWDPRSYYGEWKWITGGREITDDGVCYDPTKKLGRHFGEYKHAAEVIFPQYGRLIISTRCPTSNYGLVSCSSVSAS